MASPGGWPVSPAPTDRSSPGTPPVSPANRRTPPAVVATEGVPTSHGTRSTRKSAWQSSAVTSTQSVGNVPPTPSQPTGGQRLPRLPLTPRSMATRAHGYLVASLARSRPRPAAEQEKQAAPVPGGQKREPPTLVVDRSPIERWRACSCYIGSVHGSRLGRRSSASSSR